MQTLKYIHWVFAALAIWFGTQLPAFSLSGDLEGLHRNNSTNWGPSSSWVGGNLQGWLELDYVVVRAVLSGTPRSNKPVTIVFPKFQTDAPGFQNVYFISNSPNLFFHGAPVLSAPTAPADWSYTVNVTITNNQAGYIYFYARLSAGAHLNVGSSLQLSGEPSLSPLQIHKPDAGPGSPDLAITKTGPATAGPGDLITYTITYTNQAMGTNNSGNGVQLADRLPSLVSFVSASNGGTNEAGFLTWDLPDLTNRASGFVTYQVRVSTNAFNGQMFTNNALILSSEDDANISDNRSSVKTRVVANYPPVANSDDYTINEDAVLNVTAPGILANDTDLDPGTVLRASLVATTTNGSLNLSTNGSFLYTPDANFNGLDTFTYRASDGSNFSTVVAVTITVNPTNDSPAAVNDAFTILEDTTLSISASGVLVNDSDVDGDPLTSVLVSDVAHGTLNLNADGSFDYTPSLSYTGVDSFVYRATDGLLSSNALVTITILPINDAPVAVNDSFTILEDTTLNISAPGVLANDSDVDGDPLTAVLVSGVSNGTLALNSNGSFSYTPSLNHTGVDTFVYRATDGSLSSNASVTITILATNDRPVAVNDSYTTIEDTTLNVSAPGVLANDSDVDGDSLTAVLVMDVSHGTLALNANGAFAYTPSLNYTGVDTFVYRATDGFLSSNATVTITVLPTNDAPVAVNDSYATLEDTTLSIPAAGVLANDSDVDGDALTAVLVENVTYGTLLLNANGAFTYTPSLNYTGVDTFTYRASDSALQWGVATVTITIIPTNDQPVALDDAYTMNEDTVLVVPAPGLLANDSDVDGDAIFVSVVELLPAHGQVTWNTNGSFVYTPDTNYHGLDNFTYRIHDGSLTSELAVVTITIHSTNDVPLAVNDAYTTPEDTQLTIPAQGILTNDIDVDGNVLYAVLVNTTARGTLNLSTNGAFTYTPSLNYTGVDTFTYRATDGALTSEVATVTITINPLNDAPVATTDSYSVNEDTTLIVAAAGILTNDFDVDGDPLSAILVADVTHGTLTLSPNGAFNYTPSLNYTGVDTFTYRASDGALPSGIATVTITVRPLNDPPVAANDAYTINEDQILTVSAPGVLANDSDVDGDALATVLVSSPARGLLTLQPNGSFQYVPNSSYNGTDSFTYRARDYALTSGVATVTITVNPTNDLPVANNDAYVMNEDTVLTVPAAGVLTNDFDIDGDPLTAMLVNMTTRGTLALSTNGSFIYTPLTNYNGIDTFTYRATDGGSTSGVATVTITINPTNDTPLAVNDDNYTTPEDTTLNIPALGVLANDIDVDGDPLRALLVSTVLHGSLSLNTNGAFQYTPSLNYTGVDTFTYRATDSRATSGVATVTITITPLNDVPVANNDAYTTAEDTALNIPARGILTNDFDVDGNLLTAVLVSSTTRGSLTLSTNGAFLYTPSLNYTGIDAFTYRATDGALTSSIATVTITITPVNDTPVAMDDDAYTTPEDTTLNIPTLGVLANDIDVDGDSLRALLVSTVSHGTLTLNTNGAFQYTPSLNYTGIDTFSYRATDGRATSGVASVTITITPVNDTPVAVNDAYTTVEDTALNIPAPGVLANDIDVDGNPLQSLLLATVSHGTLALSTNGAFVYTPSLNYTGVDVFTYRATDGALTSSVATVTITVTPVNDPPVTGIAGDSHSVLEDQTLTVAAPGVLANDGDVDGDPLTSIRVSGPSNGTLTLNLNGSFVYRPATNYFGPDSFVYVANDGQTNSAPATVNITVIPVNDTPGFARGGDQECNRTSTAQTLAGWATGISAGSASESGQTLTFLVSNDNNALFSAQPGIAPNGTLTYTTASGVFGTANVRVALRDSGGTANGGVDTSSEVIFRISVNSPPGVSIVSPTNGNVLITPVTLSVIASANDPDGTVTNVQFLLNGVVFTNVGTAPFYFVRSNAAPGNYEFTAIATDNCGMASTSTVVNMEVMTNAVTAVGPIVLNRNNGLFEHFVTVSNRTSETWANGVRVYVYNLDTTNKVWNAQGTNNGIPYLEKVNAVPPGGTLQFLIQYYVPNPRTVPNPTLVAVPLPFSRPVIIPRIETIQPMPGPLNKVSFTSQTGRYYFVQSTENLVTWTTDPQALPGTGGKIDSMQNGSARKRFYRVLTVP